MNPNEKKNIGDGLDSNVRSDGGNLIDVAGDRENERKVLEVASAQKSRAVMNQDTEENSIKPAEKQKSKSALRRKRKREARERQNEPALKAQRIITTSITEGSAEIATTLAVPSKLSKTRTGRKLYKKRKEEPLEFNIQSTAIAWDSKRVYVAGKGLGKSAKPEEYIRVYDSEAGSFKTSYVGHQGPIQDVSLSRDGFYLLSASEDGSTRL